RPFRHRARRSVRELIARADHESVERVLGIQLCRAVPVKARLPDRSRTTTISGTGRFHRSLSGLSVADAPVDLLSALLRIRHELNILIFQAQVLDRLADQVSILLANVAEVGVRHFHEQRRTRRMAEASRFEPRLVGVAVDFLFQRIEHEHPRIWRGSSKIRHSKINPEAFDASNRFNSYSGGTSASKATIHRTIQEKVKIRNRRGHGTSSIP